MKELWEQKIIISTPQGNNYIQDPLMDAEIIGWKFKSWDVYDCEKKRKDWKTVAIWKETKEKGQPIAV